MRIASVTAVVAAAFMLTSVPSSAQGLAEAAAKEKERRKAQKAQAQSQPKSYTEHDLGKGGQGTFSSTSAADTPAGAAAPADASAAPKDPNAPKEKTADEIRAEKEKGWRDRVAKTNEDISRLLTRVDTIQKALNDLSQNLYGSARTQQLAEMEKVQKELAEKRLALGELEDEGRRSNYR